MSTCCAGSSAEIRRHAQPTQDQRPDQHPHRHGESEESPVDLAALPAAGEHLADDLPQRRELQEHREVLTGSGECGEVNWRFHSPLPVSTLRMTCHSGVNFKSTASGAPQEGSEPGGRLCTYTCRAATASVASAASAISSA